MTANLVMNNQLKGIEIYFDGKPSKEVRENLKANGFRYHSTKVCWYAKQSEKTISEAQKYVTNEETKPQTEQAKTINPITKTKTPQKNENNKLSLWESCQWSKIEVNNKLDTKAIAAEVRKHVRSRFPMVKFSITSSYSSISFYIVSSPFEKDSIQLKAILDYCTKALENYKYCTCDDPYGDYGSSYNFYGAYAKVDYNYIQTEQTEEIKLDMLDFETKLAQAEKEKEEQKEKDFQLYLVKQEEEKAQHIIRQTEEKKQIQTIYNNIAITDLTENNQYFVLGSQFANLNKNCTLDEYKEEVEKGDYYLNNVKITKEIHFQTEEALNYFSNMLLNDFDFLEQTGGSYTDDVRINSMTDYNNMTKEEQETVIFNLCGVAIYYNNQLQFVVDAQGFSYARYVGLVETDKVKQFYNIEELQELKGRAETLEDFSVEAITCDPPLVKTWNNEDWEEYKNRMKQIFNKNYFKLTKSIIQQLPEEAETLKVSMYKLLVEVDGIQDQFTSADLKKDQKVTLFYISDFGSMITSRITIDSIEFTKYAQYDNAVKVIYKPEKKRKLYYKYFYSDMLVYNGWLDLPETILHTKEISNDFVITKTKYLSCDKRQYDAILEHFEAQGQKPIINTYKPIF